jgi:hypothetical protein
MLSLVQNAVTNLGSIQKAISSSTITLTAIQVALASIFVGAASIGTFTMAAAATKTVTDANVKASSYVIVFPLNADAGTLQGASTCLYTVAGAGSFMAKTASGGNAAGTESIGYLVLNLA